nr:PREDICTED: uncharacterized protein LOC103313210 [Tribolium castaneum]|eukprot:XP_008194149.2 PREDICTED: uncharacterized protein LOC103313210 [Tribolium castaneum]
MFFYRIFYSTYARFLNMTSDLSNTDLHRLDLSEIFEDELFATNKNITEDDVRKNIYIYFSNTTHLSSKCCKLLDSLISCANKTIIRREKIELNLLSLLLNGAEAITVSYQYKELTPIKITDLRQPLFTEIQLRTNFNKTLKKTPTAYSTETRNHRIGKQHVIYTTRPGSMSASSSSEDILENDDSESGSCDSRSKKRKTCQKAGDFELTLGHLKNSHFDNDLKCHVEILILVENTKQCKTLAKHLGLIFFEDLLEGEAKIELRLLEADNKIYRLAHTEIIKKMMNGYSGICVTALQSVWQFCSANVKGVIYRADSTFDVDIFEDANYCMLVEDDILCYLDAFSKIMQKYLLCNVSVGINYELHEKACTKIYLPITVFIPLYIVKYFAQSFLVTRTDCPNSNVLDIFHYNSN